VSPHEPTVFVVDDDASVRRGLQRLLRSAGYRTETFASAREFLERSGPDGHGCLVLDVRLPGPSGFDLQAALAASEDPMPIIFITGHGDAEMAARAMKSGAVDFLAKPFDDRDLLAAIERALTRADRPAPP
jgi:FixJ family two-component response regulator